MSEAGQELIAGMAELRGIVTGASPAGRIHINGFAYVPEDRWETIKSAPEGQQILVWESDYGWLLAHKDHRFGWQLKSSGNFYAEMPASVVGNLRYWRALPTPPSSSTQG